MRLAFGSLAVSLLFCGSALAGDNVAPHLTAFSFSPNTIDTSTGSATVTVNATATDDLSGVGTFQVTFISPDGQIGRVGRQGFGPGLLQVTANVSVDFPKYSPAGIWTVSYAYVVDQVGNQIYLDTNALAAVGFPTHLTLGGNEQ